jgi:ankyrin repeat protein
MVRKSAFFILMAGLFVCSIFLLTGCGTQLSKAAIDGDIAMADKLIQKGEELNDWDGYGWSPLAWATYFQHPDMVKHLLDNGADPNIVTKKKYVSVPPGSTPLIIASYYGNDELVDILLQNGANKEIKNNEGYTALKYAIEYRYKYCVDLLEQKEARNDSEIVPAISTGNAKK